MISKFANDIHTYTDVQSLEQLRGEIKNNPDAVKNEVAKQFESLMLQMVLRSMREANKAFNSDLLGSNQMEFYQDIYDKQLTLALSNKGIGLANSLKINIDNIQGINPSKDKSFDKNIPIQPTTILRSSQSLPPLPTKHLFTAKNKSDAISEKPFFSSPDDFIKKLWSSAKSAAHLIGVNPDILLAQAALETDWGKKIIPHGIEGSSHNLFNIKADKNWKKPSTSIATLEDRNGLLVKINAHFRTYPSFKDSFDDYVSLLKNNARYAPVLKKVSNPREFVHALQEVGYATDEKYAEKIMAVFSSQKFKNLIAKMD